MKKNILFFLLTLLVISPIPLRAVFEERKEEREERKSDHRNPTEEETRRARNQAAQEATQNAATDPENGSPTAAFTTRDNKGGISDEISETGLTNNNADCFINSSLQFCKAFKEELNHDVLRQGMPLLEDFFNGVRFNDNACKALRSEMAEKVIKEHSDLQGVVVNGTAQSHQDAATFLRLLLEETDAPRLSFLEKSKNQSTGEERVNTPEPNIIWPIPLPADHGGSVSMQNLIDNALHPSLRQRWIDENPNDPEVEVKKELLLTGRIPATFVISLGRFGFDRQYTRGFKNQIKIREFKNNITLLAADGQQITYEPTAIICHLGPLLGQGHFITHRKEHGQWFVFDDNDVVPSTLIEGGTASKNCYLIAYQMVEEVSGQRQNATTHTRPRSVQLQDNSTDEIEALTQKIEAAQQAFNKQEEELKKLHSPLNNGTKLDSRKILQMQSSYRNETKSYLENITREHTAIKSSLSKNNLDPSATISETEEAREIDTPNGGVDAVERPLALEKFYNACGKYPQADRLILDPTTGDSVRPWNQADHATQDEQTIKALQEALESDFELPAQTTIRITNEEIPRPYRLKLLPKPRKLSGEALNKILEKAQEAALVRATPEDRRSTQNTRIADTAFSRGTETGALFTAVVSRSTRNLLVNDTTRPLVRAATIPGRKIYDEIVRLSFRKNRGTTQSPPEAIGNIEGLLSTLIDRERTLDAFNAHYAEPNRLYMEAERAWSELFTQWKEMKIYDPVRQLVQDLLAAEKQRLSKSKEETKGETLSRRTQQAINTLLTDVVDDPTISGGSIENAVNSLSFDSFSPISDMVILPDIHLSGIIGLGYALINYQLHQSRYHRRDALEEILKKMTEEDEQHREEAENSSLTAADLAINAEKKERCALQQDATRTAKFAKAIKPPTTNTRNSWEEWVKQPALHEKMEGAEKKMLIEWLSKHDATHYHRGLSKFISLSWKERMKKSKELLKDLEIEASEELSTLEKAAEKAELKADKIREEREVHQMRLEEILAQEFILNKELLSANKRLKSLSTRAATAEYAQHEESRRKEQTTIVNATSKLREIEEAKSVATQAVKEKEKEFSIAQSIATLLAKNCTILKSWNSRKIERARVRARADLEAWEELYLKEELHKLRERASQLDKKWNLLQLELGLKKQSELISRNIEEIKRKTDTNYGYWREHDRWRVYLVMEDLKKNIWPTLSAVIKKFRESPSEHSLKCVRQVANKVGNAGAMIAASAVDAADIADVLEAVRATHRTTQTAFDEYCRDTVQHAPSRSILEWIPDAAREIVDFVTSVQEFHRDRTASLRDSCLVTRNAEIKRSLEGLPNKGLGAENRPAIIGIIRQVRENIWPQLNKAIDEFTRAPSEENIAKVRNIVSACIPHYSFNSASTYASSYASVSAYAYPAASEYASSYASSFYYAYPPAFDYAHAYAPLSAYANSYASIYSSAFCKNSEEAKDAAETANMVTKGAWALYKKSVDNNWDWWYHHNIQDNLGWAVDVAKKADRFSEAVAKWKENQYN